MHILFLCLTLIFAFSAIAQDDSGPISAVTSGQQDAEIANRIRDILDALGHSTDITVQVGDGVVTLRGTANSAPEIAQTENVTTRVEGVVAARNEVVETTEIARRLDPAVDRFRDRIDQLIAFLPLALIGTAIFVIVTILGFAIARLRQPWDRFAPNAFIAEIYRQLVRLVFALTGLVLALDVMNATALLSTILGAAGIIGLALGFAVRDTVENFIASIMLSIRQPFRPNDAVEINGDQGRVIRLTSRATILLSFDGNHIRIPNATVFKSRIVNFSQHDNRQFMFPVLINRGSDLQETHVLLEQTVQSLPFVLTSPAASVWIEDLKIPGTELIVTGWVNQNDTSIALAKGEAIRQVKRVLGDAGISMTNASQAVIISNDDAVQDTESETAEIALVVAENDAVLTKTVEAERDADNAEDLLHEDAEKE
jgi:small-conductance mechanosensitive channel